MTELANTLPKAPASPAKRPYTWKRLCGFTLFLMVLATSIYVGGLYYTAHITPPDVGTQDISIDIPRSIEKPGSVAFAKKARLNILCLGVDYNYSPKDEHYTKWVRSDTIFILSVDSEGRLLNMLSIPRDCRVEIPGVGMDKINAAFAMKETGDLDLTRKTIEKFLGITLDHTIIIKEYAAKKMVDVIGGVTVDVEKDMNYDDNWGHLHIHLKKGLQRLNGEQAVGYVRFRNDEEGDRGRIRRQQQFLDALFKELRKPENFSPSRLKDLATTIKENIGTSLTPGEIVDLANVYRKFDRKRLQRARIDGDDVNIGGLAYIQPDEREKERVVYRLLVDPNGIAPESIRVEVLNGSSVEGSARALADILRARGYQIVLVDKTTKSSQTFIEDHRDSKDALAAMRQMLGDLPIRTRREETRRADVTIVVGEDWKTLEKPYEHAGATASPAPSDSPRAQDVPVVDVPAPAWTPPSSNAPAPISPRPSPVTGQVPAPAGPDVVLPTTQAPPPPGNPTPTAEAPSPGGERF